MIYDFNIQTAGYDLPAFIKNPDNTGADTKNILELLKLTNTKWLQCEQEYNILKYL